jgi:hypothetical protein
MKRLFFGLAWLLAVSGLILSGVAGYQTYYQAKAQNPELALETEDELLTPVFVAQGLPENGQVKGVETVLETEDARAAIVANFLERHDSPLQPADHYGAVFVDIADRHGFDFRLLPAIAMQESNLCKRIPEGSFNCLGFGIHERGTLGFPNFEANFERAGRELKLYYIDKGLTTPYEIMRKYTPGSDGSWAESVNQWMAEMRYNDRQLGRELKTDGSVLEFAQPTPTASPDPE